MTDKSADLVATIPVFQEEAFVDKRLIDTEQVRIRTSSEEESVLVRETVSTDQVEIRRIAVERAVEHAPAIREEDGVTIVPILEERLVVEKRLFVVEEIHIVRTRQVEAVELPTTLRRTRVDVDRTDLTSKQEDVHGRTE